jgi:hypothetical protein
MREAYDEIFDNADIILTQVRRALPCEIGRFTIGVKGSPHHILPKRLNLDTCPDKGAQVRLQPRAITKVGETLRASFLTQAQMNRRIVKMRLQKFEQTKGDWSRNPAQRIAQPCLVKPNRGDNLPPVPALLDCSAQNPGCKAPRHGLWRDSIPVLQQIVDPAVNR